MTVGGPNNISIAPTSHRITDTHTVTPIAALPWHERIIHHTHRHASTPIAAPS